MKLLTISPSSIGYRWEIEVLAVNSIGHGWPAEDMIWLSYGGSDEEQSEDARLATALGIEHHHFPDDRPAKKYPTSIRPWLWSRFLREHPARQRGSYFYCDSDVIFSRLPDLTALEQAVTPREMVGVTNLLLHEPFQVAERLQRTRGRVLGRTHWGHRNRSCPLRTHLTRSTVGTS